LNGRGGGIRTPDPLLPKQMRYQTALRPDAVVDCTKLDVASRRVPAPGARSMRGLHARVEEQIQQPCHEQNGHGEDGADHERDAGEEEPVAPVIAVRVLEVLGEQGVVAAVGLPGDVEDVAEEGDGADDDVEGEVDQHARDGDVGCAARPCGEDDDRGGEAGEDVADAGDEADDAIDAEADGGAGDAEPGVEHAAEQVEIFIAEEAAADAEAGVGRQNLGFALFVAASGGHDWRLPGRAPRGLERPS
jgi:hypothetical protein